MLSFDAEALGMLDDGSGFVSDVFGAYIARFDAGLRITGISQLPAAARPHRPFGTLNFDGDTTPTNGRRDNLGLEGLAITPDGSRLFALLQSGLVQDIDLSLAESRSNARLFVYDISGPLVNTPLLASATAAPDATSSPGWKLIRPTVPSDAARRVCSALVIRSSLICGSLSMIASGESPAGSACKGRPAASMSCCNCRMVS